MSWVSTCIIIIGLLVSCSNALAGDPKTRYEKDGFIIDAASNGGNCVGCEWIVVDGKIPADAGEQLAAWVKRAGYENISLTVLLDSAGGSLVGGVKLGRAIRKLGLMTAIGRTMPDPDIGGSAETQAPGGVIRPVPMHFSVALNARFNPASMASTNSTLTPSLMRRLRNPSRLSICQHSRC